MISKKFLVNCGFVALLVFRPPLCFVDHQLITSVLPTFARAVREHWAIENSLPWRLEVIFGDDACRIRTPNGPAIMTSIKQLCLNLFEPENSPISLSKTRRQADWDDNYRAKVLFS